jgi:hypothetical protein
MFFTNNKDLPLEDALQPGIHSLQFSKRVCMVVGFTTTCTISAYHHSFEFKPCSWQGVLDTTLCDKVCQ